MLDENSCRRCLPAAESGPDGLFPVRVEVEREHVPSPQRPARSIEVGELGTPPSRITGNHSTVSSAVMALVLPSVQGAAKKGRQARHLLG